MRFRVSVVREISDSFSSGASRYGAFQTFGTYVDEGEGYKKGYPNPKPTLLIFCVLCNGLQPWVHYEEGIRCCEIIVSG